MRRSKAKKDRFIDVVREAAATQSFSYSLPHIELLGNRELMADGCGGIKEISDGFIILRSGKTDVKITGQGLTIKTVMSGMTSVSGKIESIEFM